MRFVFHGKSSGIRNKCLLYSYAAHRTMRPAVFASSSCGAHGKRLPASIRLGVPVFDLLFLNRHKFPQLHPDFVFKKEVKLLVPQVLSLAQVRNSNSPYCLRASATGASRDAGIALLSKCGSHRIDPVKLHVTR